MIIKDFDTRERVLVVAEIGNNHEGNFDVARRLVEAAAEAGAHAVKFQTFKTERFISPTDVARVKRLKSFELSYPQFAALADLARSRGLLFISTPLDLGSAEFLDGIVDAFKIASADNDFYPLLARVAGFKKPMIVSTGVSDLAQAERSVSFVRREWSRQGTTGDLAVLHCVSAYPTPPEEAGLRAIPALANACQCTIGYSDHTIGTEAAVLAVALGARIIEKHFTLDKQYSDFRDHQLSADPADMRTLVTRVAAAERMLGDGVKRVQPSEEVGIKAYRRSIAVGRDLTRGHRIELSDLIWIRPGGRMAPGREDELVGKALIRDVTAGEQLDPTDVESVRP